MSQTKPDKDEIQHWVDLLRSKTQQDRLHAASQLGRLGVRTRGAAMSRGSLSKPAEARMAREQLDVALKALADTDVDVRREVVFYAGA